ncbi:MAG: O-antigen ligase family protein [Caldilineaceae bacterium]|nr:O-antigen ligase family protein [Caldilineaceae bacterium]
MATITAGMSSDTATYQGDWPPTQQPSIYHLPVYYAPAPQQPTYRNVLDGYAIPALIQIYTIASLILFAGGMLPLLMGNQEGELFAQSSTKVQYIFLAIYGISFICSLPYLRQILSIARQMHYLIALVLWVCVSALWSFAPEISLRRAIAIIGAAYFGLFFSVRYSLKEQLKLLAIAFGLIIILNYLFVYLWPEYGLMHSMQHVGSWKGIFRHKNLLSRISAFATCLVLLYAYNSPRTRGLAVIFALLAVVQVYYSNSLGGVLILLGLLAIIFPMRYVLPRLNSSSLALYLTALCYSVALSLFVAWNIETIIALINLDTATIIGRFEIWRIIWQSIKEVFWLGYGFNAFWLGWDGPARNVWLATTWSAPHAHNSLLDVWLELGIIGVTIFLVGFVNVFRKAVVYAQGAQNPANLLPLAFLVFFALSMLPESVILQSNDIYWVLYVAITASLLKVQQDAEGLAQ